jgi:predicted kinase
VGRLIAIAGPPCSGKSTLAEEVARRRGIPHLSMDATRQRILPGAAHTRADRQAAYRAMHFAAELLLRAGAGAVLDAPYGHTEDRAELAQIVAASGAELRLVECRISPEAAVERFRRRGPDSVRLDLTGEVVAQQVREYRYSGAGLELDTDTLAPGECLAQAEAWLGKG